MLAVQSARAIMLFILYYLNRKKAATRPGASKQARPRFAKKASPQSLREFSSATSIACSGENSRDRILSSWLISSLRA
jgi:hypothetical protein